MAKLTDPDDLIRTTHVVYNTGTKRITVLAAAGPDTGSITIDVVASAKTYTRTAGGSGSFITDGFIAGIQVTMSGFTNSGNNGLKKIATVTATVLTMEVSTGLVDETGNGNERALGATLDAKDGVTLKCLYSYTKEEWKNDAALIPFEFPFVPITDEQFELVEGWDFFNDSSRYLIRDAGWAVVDPSTGLPNAKWSGIISLGSIESDDQPYYQQESGGAPTNFQTTGVVNQATQVFKDADADGNQESGDFDFTTFMQLFTREQAQIYGKSKLSDIGVTVLASQAYRFPLATAADLNVTASDASIDADSPYTKILARYYSAAYKRPVDSATLRNFGIVIDVGTFSANDGSAPGGGLVLTTGETIPDFADYVGGTVRLHDGPDGPTTRNVTASTSTTLTVDGANLSNQSGTSFMAQRAAPIVATKKQIYEKVQRLLRLNSDIDSNGGSAVTGKTADELAEFVGSTLKMGSKSPVNPKGASLGGVLIEGFDANDTNDLVFFDNGGTARTYPFVAAGTIFFNPNLDNDPDAAYWMFYEYTERFTNIGFGISGVSGAVATLDSSVTDLVAELANGDYIRLEGFANAGNNGIWRLTGAPAGSGPWTAEITKQDGAQPVNEAAGPTVSLDKKPIDSPDAIIVKNNAGVDINGLVPGPSVGFDFDYDNNVQGGRTAGTNAAIVIRALGLATAQFVETTGTIIRATGQSFSLVAPLERNYSNP